MMALDTSVGDRAAMVQISSIRIDQDRFRTVGPK